VRPLAEHLDRLEFNSMTGVAIAVAYWRRAGSAGGPRTAAPTRAGKCPKSRCGVAARRRTSGKPPERHSLSARRAAKPEESDPEFIHTF